MNEQIWTQLCDHQTQAEKTAREKNKNKSTLHLLLPLTLPGSQYRMTTSQSFHSALVGSCYTNNTLGDGDASFRGLRRRLTPRNREQRQAVTSTILHDAYSIILHRPNTMPWSGHSAKDKYFPLRNMKEFWAFKFSVFWNAQAVWPGNGPLIISKCILWLDIISVIKDIGCSAATSCFTDEM